MKQLIRRLEVLSAITGIAVVAGVGGTTLASRDFNQPFTTETDLISAPTIIKDVLNSADLAGLNSSEKPQSAILTINETLNVVDSSGTTIKSLDNALSTDLKTDILPVLRVNTDAVKTSLLSYLTEKESFTDFSVVSSDVRILSEISDACAYARTMYEPEQIYTPIQTVISANLAGGAQTVLLDNTVSYDTVRAIRARYKSVWIKTGEMIADVINTVALGADGVIASSVTNAYSAYAKLTKENAVATAPFVAAHRGYLLNSVENTAGSIKDAAKLGATHVEVDIRVTKDKEVVLLHNETIDSVTNGHGKVKDMTLEELRQYHLSDGQVIPTLPEVFEAVKDEDIIMMIELKSEQVELVPLFEKIVREYDMFEKIVVISFYPNQLVRMRALLPEIPTSLVLYSSGIKTAIPAANTCDSGISMQYTKLSTYYGSDTLTPYQEYVSNLKSRGYAPWLWTYTTNTVSEGVLNGIVGVTSDNPETVVEEIAGLKVENQYTIDDISTLVEGTYKVKGYNFRGEEIEVDAEVIFLTSTPTANTPISTAVLYCKANNGTYGIYSQVVTFMKA